MSRRLVALLLVAAATGCVGRGPPAPLPELPAVAFADGFETGLDGWTAEGPDANATARWSVAVEPVEEGGAAAALRAPASNASDAVWLRHLVPVDPGSTYEARLSVRARGEGAATVLVFLGDEPPAGLAAFGSSDANLTQEAPLAADWSVHALRAPVGPFADPRAVLAVGLRRACADDAEACAVEPVAAWLDDVRLELFAR